MCPNTDNLPESPLEKPESTTNGNIPREMKVKGRTKTQVFACLAVSLGSLSAGSVNGWTASTLPSLTADPDISMGTLETAWTVSIISLGCMVGSIFAGRLLDLFGRRRILMIAAPVLIAGWVTIALAPNTAIVLVGRSICGIATAVPFSAAPVYCTETPEARLRGSLGLIPSLFITFGVVTSYISGAFFSWRVSCYICAVPILLMFIALWFVPESPYWYLLKGRKEECMASLRWLRGPKYDFSVELGEMEAKLNSVGKKMEFRELLRPRTRKPFMISLFMSTLQQVSGGNILMMFTGMIFMSAGIENHNMATVYTGLIQIVFTLLCILLVDRLGRKLLIITSTFVIGVAMNVLGVYYLMGNVLGIQWPTWVPLATVLTAVAGYCLGCRSIPWLLAAELFNTTIRSTANTATIFHNRLMNLLVLQVYPFYQEAFGSHTVFFTFGAMSLLCSLLSLVIVPETKGKTLEQIQQHFESSKKTKSKSQKNLEKNKDIICVSSSADNATSV